MSDLYYVNPDVLIRPVEGEWIVSNPRLRTHVALDAAAISSIVEANASRTADDWASIFGDCAGSDRTHTKYGENGLHADHSGLTSAGVNSVNGGALFNLLRKRRVLIKSSDEAFDLVAPLTNMLDREHIGTFHQRVGQYLMVDKRTREPWRAWQDQKFTPGGLGLRDGAYSRIQEPFFDATFTHDRLDGKRVLDFGSGNGYYSAKFAAAGAKVLGLDSSPELVGLAKDLQTNVDFVLTPTFEDALAELDKYGPASFDFVYLQDTLLLLLAPPDGNPSPLLPTVFAAFRRVLKPSGRLCAMEPNAQFWLAGRYGAAEAPYAVVTEFRSPR